MHSWREYIFYPWRYRQRDGQEAIHDVSWCLYYFPQRPPNSQKSCVISRRKWWCQPRDDNSSGYFLSLIYMRYHDHRWMRSTIFKCELSWWKKQIKSFQVLPIFPFFIPIEFDLITFLHLNLTTHLIILFLNFLLISDQLLTTFYFQLIIGHNLHLLMQYIPIPSILLIYFLQRCL